MPTNLLLTIFLFSCGGICGIFFDHFRSFQKRQQKKIAEALQQAAQPLTAEAFSGVSSAPQEVEESAAPKKTVQKKEAEKEYDAGESELEKEDTKINHKNIGALLRRAELFLARKDFPEAEKLFIKILAFDEDHTNALQKLAYLYLETAAYPRAETLYRQLSERPSPDPGVYTNLGLALFHQKKFPEAIESYERAIRLEPDRAARYANLGQALFVMKELDQAIDCFRKAVAKEPRNIGFLYLLADACLEGKHFVEAKKWYEKILDLSPYDADAKEEVRRLKALGF